MLDSLRRIFVLDGVEQLAHYRCLLELDFGSETRGLNRVCGNSFLASNNRNPQNPQNYYGRDQVTY
jgi:hypothetical protein